MKGKKEKADGRKTEEKKRGQEGQTGRRRDINTHKHTHSHNNNTQGVLLSPPSSLLYIIHTLYFKEIFVFYSTACLALRGSFPLTFVGTRETTGNRERDTDGVPSCPALPCPALSCHVLPCLAPALPCPRLSTWLFFYSRRGWWEVCR